MEQRKFKKHEICLMVNAIIHDDKALTHATVYCKSRWGYEYRDDEDDKAVEIALLFERLYVANQLAISYNERIGWTEKELCISMIDIEYMRDCTNWRQLEDLELLQLISRLRDSVYSPDGTLCFSSASDLEQLQMLITYYYDKLLIALIDESGSGA